MAVRTPAAATHRVPGTKHGPAIAPPVVADALRSPGRPLDGATRRSMERGFGHDFSGVRVHAGPMAAAAAGAVNAAAYAVGRDVVFGHDRYAPATSAGRRLIAHELAHVVQQRGKTPTGAPRIAAADGTAEREADAAARDVPTGAAPVAKVAATAAPAVQRQAEPAIGANAILPYPETHQIQIDQKLDETFAAMLGAVDPNAAAMLKALTGQRATVVTSTADLVRADFNQRKIALEGIGEFRDVQLTLARGRTGALDFVISGLTGDPPARTEIFARRDLSAARSGSGFVLSAGTGAGAVRQLGTTRQGQTVDLAVFKDSFIAQVPGWLRGRIPDKIEALSLSELPPATAGSAAVERAAQEATSRAVQQRATRRQQLELGAGLSTLSDPRRVLRAAWQYTFQPIPATGTLLGVPLQIAIQYAPSSELVGRLSSGASTSLGALRIPVNLRLTAGIAGGRARGEPVAGITAGGGIGGELGRWRLQLDADYLFNLVGPGAGSVVASGGVQF